MEERKQDGNSPTEDVLDDHATPHDSLVTVRLSGPSNLTVNTNGGDEVFKKPSLPTTRVPTPNINLDGADHELDEEVESPQSAMRDAKGNRVLSPLGSESSQDEKPRPGSDGSESAGDGVNWEALEKTEKKEPRDANSDDSTALLLARLEQENNMIATNPKSGGTKAQEVEGRKRNNSRPVSIQQLKEMVNGASPTSLRYSMTAAPPMTDLEFYAALVQDYTRTAQRLPTLLSKKIRSGIPPPLRGVVWQSMSGARDRELEDHYERLSGESSPYEGMIGKDLGRSFPGVDMFRDSQGDGQRMLGRVLKCFSLYDTKIGYCQGLGFLVGPLLMHMGDKEAFCVLVRLMEHYDLRGCFLPDLSGLHLRIHQFRELLKKHNPKLSMHLDALQIEPAYVSQWFLSFFAVTCPLPMLFRIYDVIFAEGASETMMRVALSLMRKNEGKILACTEMEDVMQLLLSRGLWDGYNYNADAFVNDFVGFTGVVTKESLQALEASYKEPLSSDAALPENMESAASRFLGRLWASSNPPIKPPMLSPGLTAPSRPVSFLRRSASKQSLASTMNSADAGGSESAMSSSTYATTMSRDSSTADVSSLRGQSVAMPKTDIHKNLHSQIEDLLTALSELQRGHADLATQLQREREEREEDRQAVQSLLGGLKKTTDGETVARLDIVLVEETAKDIAVEAPAGSEKPSDVEPPFTTSQAELSAMLEAIESRFAVPLDNRRSSMLQSKSQLRDELIRSKELLANESSKTLSLDRQISEHQQEIHNLKDQVKESHVHIRAGHAEKQRLEKQIHDLRVRNKSNVTTPDASRDNDSEWLPRSGAATTPGSKLKEFKLGRTNTSFSVPTYSKRTSSLSTVQGRGHGSPPPSKHDVDTDALVSELVQAKTAEAVAKQEAEEAKAKLESLRRMMGISGGDSPSSTTSGSSTRMTPQAMMGATVLSFGGYLTKKVEGTPGAATAVGSTNASVATPAGSSPAVTGGAWGGWGGWGKRNVSNGNGTE